MTQLRSAGMLAVLLTTGVPSLAAQLQVGEAELAEAGTDALRAAAMLAQIWRELPDSAARVVAYSDSQPTGCGLLGPDNAFYCAHDDTIYYDAWFAAVVRAMVAAELETDGDHAVFAILAHEWGHRIYGRLRPGTAGIPVFAELTADCLAGAALNSLHGITSVAADDTAEAALALRLLGDEADARQSPRSSFGATWSTRPAPGDPAAPGRFQAGLTRHGAADERARSFQRGFRHGAGKCMKELERR
jgi:predicted metalloprotease